MSSFDISPVTYQVLPIGWFAVVAALALAALAILVLVALWVYRDAERRRMNGALWVIILLVGGVIGLIVYLIVRESHPIGGYPYGYGSAAAGYGWYPPAAPSPPAATPGGFAPPAYCRSCGAPLVPGGSFCARCGAKV